MASSKKCRSSSSSWSDLLGLVLPRLHSLADRVHVGAVCRPWRSGARQHRRLPPPMPWVALGDRAYLDVVNSDAVHKLRDDLGVPANARCRGSADHLLFLTRDGGRCGCFLVDPFSGAVLPVADLALFIQEQTREEVFSLSYRLSLIVHKVVLLWPPHDDDEESSSEPPVVAALIKNSENEYRTTIFVCRAGADTGVTKESYSAMSVDLRLVQDVAFFGGKLYALSKHDQLFVVELGEGAGGNSVITGAECVIKTPGGGHYKDFESDDDDAMVDFIAITYGGIKPTNDAYLVQSGDQLLMLERWAIEDSSHSIRRIGRTGSFSVYEVDFGCSPCHWTPVSSLSGRAVFLGRHCSKSVPVGDGHYAAQEDCVYFVIHTDDSGIYNMKDYKVRPLVPDTKVLRGGWQSWVFPDQSIIQAHYDMMAHEAAASLDDRDPVFDLLYGPSH